MISVHGKINGECFAILIEPSQATGKYYQFYDAFNTDLVTAFWNKGKDIVAANKTRAGWLVATQNENKGSEQQIICDKLENVKAEAAELAKRGNTSSSFLSATGSNAYGCTLTSSLTSQRKSSRKYLRQNCPTG